MWKYGLEHDIRFNSKKSAVIIFRNFFEMDFSYPSFVMNGESIGVRDGGQGGGSCPPPPNSGSLST